MQKILVALALSTASAFVAPLAKSAGTARAASDGDAPAAPASTGFGYDELQARAPRRVFARGGSRRRRG